MRNERKELLKHPVVQKFINSKWAAYGIVLHICNVVFYLLFLILLTTLALTSINPQEETCKYAKPQALGHRVCACAPLETVY